MKALGTLLMLFDIKLLFSKIFVSFRIPFKYLSKTDATENLGIRQQYLSITLERFYQNEKLVDFYLRLGNMTQGLDKANMQKLKCNCVLM